MGILLTCITPETLICLKYFPAPRIRSIGLWPGGFWASVILVNKYRVKFIYKQITRSHRWSMPIMRLLEQYDDGHTSRIEIFWILLKLTVMLLMHNILVEGLMYCFRSERFLGCIL